MKRKQGLILILILASAFLVSHAAGDDDAPFPLSGAIGLAAMYDSYFNVEHDLSNDPDEKSDFIYNLDAKLGLYYSWRERWRLELDLQGLAYRPNRYVDYSWYVGNGNLFFGYSFGANAVSLLESVRYYTVPDGNAVDLFRNTLTLAYKRRFAPLWEGRIGYENVANIHPDYEGLNYLMNGGFLEVRNTWTPLASTYYSFDCFYYVSNDEFAPPFLINPPREGYRYSGEIGFDVLFATRHNLKGAYTFQVDRGEYEAPEMPERIDPPPGEPGQPPDHGGPPPSPLDQVRNFEGEQFSLEVDGEFNYTKHKASLLYSVRLAKRYTLSFYNEYIYKDFTGGDYLPPDFDENRIDNLFMSSVWFTARTWGELYAKTYYVFRTDRPSDSEEHIDEHIASIGLEYRF